MIIDDNSCQEHINSRELYNTILIQSEYTGRGELLPYIYYLQHPFADTVVILHDSVFINQYIDFSCYKYKLLWEFVHMWDQIRDETTMIRALNNNELLKFYENKNLWKGCFGCMAVIRHAFLKEINQKYNISILVDYVLNRYNRSSFERVLACLLQANGEKETMFGIIHDYCKWGTTFNEMDNTKHLPLTKVWTGR
ncbi:MAG: hypothetical protein ACOVRN_04135 [Flavobacterium sp.]